MTSVINPASVARPSKRARLPRWIAPSESGIYYAMAVIWILLAVMTTATGVPAFLAPANLANIFYQTSFVAIVAVTMTLVLVSGNFDLSVGSTAALCGASVLLLTDSVGVYPAIGLSMVIGCVIGLLNGSIVQLLGINAFIVTLGTMTALRGILLIITGGKTASASNRTVIAGLRALENGAWTTPNLLLLGALGALVATVILFARGRRMPALLAGAAAAVLVIASLAIDARWTLAKPVYYMFAIVGLAWFVTRYTIVGRRLDAVGANQEAARLSGINVRRYKMVPFVLNGLAAAIVGILFAARIGAVLPNTLSGLELTAIAAAILGGTSLYGGSGNVIKTLSGAVVLFSLVNGFDIFGLGSSYQSVIEGVVLIIAAAIYTLGGKRR